MKTAATNRGAAVLFSPVSLSFKPSKLRDYEQNKRVDEVKGKIDNSEYLCRASKHGHIRKRPIGKARNQNTGRKNKTGVILQAKPVCEAYN